MNSKSESSLFVFRSGKTILILLVYIDDILITGNDPVKMKKIIESLNAQFTLKNLISLSYFLGFEAHRTKSGIYLIQKKYMTDLLSKANMLNAKSNPTPMCQGTKIHLADNDLFEQPTLYRTIIGAL